MDFSQAFGVGDVVADEPVALLIYSHVSASLWMCLRSSFMW